jgi:flagellar hook protein FlgE
MGTDRITGTGTATFSTGGQFLVQNPQAAITLLLPNEGTATPLVMTPDFSELTGFSNTESKVYLSEQDGFPLGTLYDFSVGSDGIITGIFTNGITRTLAQIMLARFANPNGLLADGNNMFRVGPNSGQPVNGKPGSFGMGVVQGGVLEASNVDFAQEFTQLVIAQRAFQANARLIRTADAMLDELVNIV